MPKPTPQHDRPLTAGPPAGGGDAFVGFDRLDANFVMTPNQFLDLCLPHCSRSGARLIGFMIRQILGFRGKDGHLLREQITVSYQELIRHANVSKGSLPKAIGEAERLRFIERIQMGQKSTLGCPAVSALFALRWDQREDGTYAYDLDDFEGFFNGIGRTTPLPNQFFDELLPHESGAVVKVVGCILRHTIGFQDRYGGRRTSTALSYDRIREASGLGGYRHVAAALRHALARGYIRRIRRGTFDANGGRGSKAAVYAVRWFGDPLDQLPDDGADDQHATPDHTRLIPVKRATPGTTPKREAGDRVKKGSGASPQKGKRTQVKKGSGTGSEREAVDHPKKGSNRKKDQRHLEIQQPAGAVGTSSERAIKALVGSGLDDRTAGKLVEAAGEPEVLQQIAWLDRRRPTRNPAGMLRRAIEERWPEPQEVRSSVLDDAADFAKHAYAALSGSAGESVAEPSAADSDAASRVLEQLDGDEDAASAGRRFGTFVRGAADGKAVPRTVSTAVRSFGDRFVEDHRQQVASAQQREASLRQRARELHEQQYRPAYQRYLVKLERQIRTDEPDRYAAFTESRQAERQDIEQTPHPKLRETMLRHFEKEPVRLDAFVRYFNNEVPDFWSWDRSLHAKPFTS